MLPRDKITALEGVSEATVNWYVLHDSSAWVRASGVEKRIQDEALLQKIAVEDRDKTVRIAAVKKTQDQRFLERVSLSGDSQEVRREAVARLTNQELVQKIALDRSQHPEVRHAAVVALESDAVFAAVIGEKKPYYIKSEYVWQWLSVRVKAMKDQEALKRLAWSAEPPSIQIFAAEALVDQPILADLVHRHPEKRVREAAVKRLTDQGLLLAIALNHPEEIIRADAARRLEDQAALAKLFATELTEGIRSAAVGNVTDPDLLRKLSRDPSEGVRAKAAKNLRDEAELVRLVDEDSSEVALAAAQNVSNQEVLLRWAKAHPDSKIRWLAIQRLDLTVGRGQLVVAALDRIQDPFLGREMLASVSTADRLEAVGSVNALARRAAVEELVKHGEASRNILERMAFDDPDTSVRRAALKGLDDPGSFRRAAKNDADPFIRAFALEYLPPDDPDVVSAILNDPSYEVRGRTGTGSRIRSPTVARDVASRSADPVVRRSLVQRIEDEDFLEKLENTDPDASVRKAAKERLQVLRRRK